MKNLIAIIIAACFLTGCAKEATFDGVTYKPYGIVNASSYRADNVCYEVSIGNVLIGILLIETIIAPAAVIGWGWYQPDHLKNGETCNIYNTPNPPVPG